MILSSSSTPVIGAGIGIGRAVAQAAVVLFAMTNPFLTGALLPVDGGGQLT